MKKIIKKGMAILLAGTMILGTTGTTIKNVSANEESSIVTFQIVPPEQIKYKKPEGVKSISKPTGVKVYRSTEAALISWQKVEGADYYKIYRKEGKSNWLYLGNTYEKDFYASTYVDNVREFVDIRYKSSKKKSSDSYKKKAYNYKKKYTYKIIAVNGNVKSTGATCTSKKWKTKKSELSYYTLYLVNKKRKEKGKPFYIWGHSYEKGSLIRAKELITQTKKAGNKWHQRPNGKNWANAFVYMNSQYMVKDPATGKTGTPGLYAEDVGYSNGDTKDIFKAYCRSKGHYGPLMLNYDDVNNSTKDGPAEDIKLISNGVDIVLPKEYAIRESSSLTAATYSKNILKNTVYHELVIGDEPYIIKK